MIVDAHFDDMENMLTNWLAKKQNKPKKQDGIFKRHQNTVQYFPCARVEKSQSSGYCGT